MRDIKVFPFVVCNIAERSPNGEVIARNIINNLTLPCKPTAYTFSIVFGLNNLEMTGKHLLRVEVNNSDNLNISTLGPVEVDLDAVSREADNALSGFNVSPLPEEELGIIVTTTFGNVFFNSIGYHSITVYYDDFETFRHMLFVRYQTPIDKGGE